MEKKTLAEIMAEPATVEAIIKKAMEINELLLKVENMPELNDEDSKKGYHTVPRSDCVGCAFKFGDRDCLSVNCSGDYRKDKTFVIFVKDAE